jgi:hypothetical protein
LHPGLVEEIAGIEIIQKSDVGKFDASRTGSGDESDPGDFKTADILLEDERGHRVDFQALRLTCITRLQRAGVRPVKQWSWRSAATCV